MQNIVVKKGDSADYCHDFDFLFSHLPLIYAAPGDISGYVFESEQMTDEEQRS